MKLRVLSFLFFDVAEKKGGRERERQGLGWVEVVFDGFYGRNGVRGCVRVGLRRFNVVKYCTVKEFMPRNIFEYFVCRVNVQIYIYIYI